MDGKSLNESLGPNGGTDLPQVQVTVLYEDLATALRVKESMDELVLKTHCATIESRFWRLDLLRDPFLREQAALAAAGSGAIVLSLHEGSAFLIEIITEWLRRWLACKTDQPCALNLLLDEKSRCGPAFEALSALLANAARSGHADLIYGISPLVRLGSVSDSSAAAAPDPL